jgi:hypothetical protein
VCGRGIKAFWAIKGIWKSTTDFVFLRTKNQYKPVRSNTEDTKKLPVLHLSLLLRGPAASCSSAFLRFTPLPPHTHTLIYIYMYMYIYALFQRESDHCSWRGPGPPATAHKSSIYPSIPSIYCPMMNIYLSINATYCIGRMYPAVDICVQYAMT